MTESETWQSYLEENTLRPLLLTGEEAEQYVEEHQILIDPPQPDPETNTVRIPDAGGLGMEINRDALRDSRIGS